jgi:predicted RNase H-like nuclease (RuvC/YqgF family)
MMRLRNFNIKSQWEEMMMMTERQLKAVRAEKSDTSAIKKLQSDVKVLENKLQNKKDENSNLSREISDLKRYNILTTPVYTQCATP